MKNKILKVTAISMVINILSVTMAPTVSYALTGGPSAPEFSSFEPVDTTDMVDLSSGDFTYSLPLLEVPGPEGGYPLALSYHAGISPGEEASWTGLGWSLNVGSINRYVNGHPDDMNGSSELVRDMWSGGETKTTSVGLGIGLGDAGGAVGFGVGLVFANDTYKGRGVGANFSAGIVSSSGVGAGVFGGVNPYGGGFVGLGISAGTTGSAVGASTSVGVMLTSDNTGEKLSAFSSMGVSVSPGPKSDSKFSGCSLIEGSISTDANGGATTSILGVSAQSINSNSGVLSTTSSGFAITVPLFYGLYASFSRGVTRYYLDQFDNTTAYGSLYAKNIPTNGNYKNITFDCFAMKSPQSNYSSDADVETGGSMPAYDTYQVMGQGIGGVMEPRIYEAGSLFRRVAEDGSGNPVNGVSFDYQQYDAFTQNIAFRFTGDFASSFVRENIGTTLNSSTDYINGITAKIGKNGLDYSATSIPDFNKTTGQLAGSRNIEWFSNSQIESYSRPDPSNIETPEEYRLRLANMKGFIPDLKHRQNYLEVNGEYAVDARDNIGGFMITNASGVNYHYSIPVYNFNEYSEYTSNETGVYSRKITKGLPFAYTWLLTAVTGPDYVDRQPYGVVDENDWGYYIAFEYGKWTDKYIWRTPESGEEKDMDSDTKMYSTGRKELYYLDAIKTRSHTALFVKDIKRDGKGIGSRTNGGFEVERNGQDIVSLPVSTLKLSKILLYTNRVLRQQLATNYGANSNGQPISTVDELKTMGNTLDNFYMHAGVKVTYQLGDNVLDENDLTNAIPKAAIRQIVLNHSYDLCPQTPNSFNMNYAGNYEKSNENSGKLTLESIEVKGLNEVKSIPATKFDYWLESTPYNKEAKDVWGAYKSDFTTNESLRKRTQQITTEASAQNVHAWSLKEIKTSIGASININYESDRYRSSGMIPFKNIALKSVERHSATNQIKLSFYNSELMTNYNQLYNELLPQSNITLKCLLKCVDYSGGLWSGGSASAMASMSQLQPFMAHDLSVKIISVSASEMIIESTPLYNALNTLYTVAGSGGGVYTLGLGNGNILFNKNTSTDTYGGGLRVSNISVIADNVENITRYKYENGTTSYDPIDFNMYQERSITSGIDLIMRKNFRDNLYTQYAELLSVNAFLSPPGVVYNKVLIQDYVRQYSQGATYEEIPGVGSTEYEFMVFDKSTMFPRVDGGSRTLPGDNYQLQVVRFKDFRNQVGLLKRIKKYSGHDKNGLLMNELTNQFLHEGINNDIYNTILQDRHNNQGRHDQVYYERKTVSGTKKLTITEVEEYPIVTAGQTNINYDYYATSRNDSRALAFDYYTGEPLITWTKDPYNNEFITRSFPAYSVYPDMGYKIFNGNNKNMLNQSAAVVTYKVAPKSGISNPVKYSDYDTLSVVEASAAIWGTGISVSYANDVDGIGITTQNDIWRKQSSYIWLGNDNVTLNTDGTHPMADFTFFNFKNLSNNGTLWKKNQEVTRTSLYSQVLEVVDFKGIYSSMLWDPSYKYSTAVASNARQSEIAYTGGEFYEYYIYNTLGDASKNVYEGNVLPGMGTFIRDAERAHTGNYCLRVNSNQEGFKYRFTPVSGKSYHASVWLYLPGSAEGSGNSLANNAKLVCRNKQTGAIICEAVRNTNLKSRSHYLLDLNIYASQIPHPGGVYPELEIVCLSNNADRSIFFDDFRFHPLKSSFTSYVYDLDRGLMTHMLNDDNYYVRYEYDNMGKIIRIYKEIVGIAEKKLMEQKFNYGNQQ